MTETERLRAVAIWYRNDRSESDYAHALSDLFDDLAERHQLVTEWSEQAHADAETLRDLAEADSLTGDVMCEIAQRLDEVADALDSPDLRAGLAVADALGIEQ